MTFHIIPWHRETDVPVQRGRGFGRRELGHRSWPALQEEINSLFDSFMGSGAEFPSLFTEKEGSLLTDLIETKNGYKVEAELPGMGADDVEVTIDEGYLAIKGKKEKKSEEKDEEYVRRERYYGTCERSISLPEAANTDKAKATFKKGVLTVEIPKKKDAVKQTRKVEVKEAA